MKTKRKNILSIVGARPQFIKLAPVSRAIRRYFNEIIVHTGQHYDDNMSGVFFDVLKIPQPDYNAGIGSGLHGSQTGKMMIELEKIILKQQMDAVLVFGDTNSTLAGALVATKLQLPLGHIEAGLRSYNKTMPEEINRVLTDHSSDWLFCPSKTAVVNLEKEGIRTGVYFTGDVMYDALLENVKIAHKNCRVIDNLALSAKKYYLATLHRPATVDDPANMKPVLQSLDACPLPVVFPVHPRTRTRILTWFNNMAFPNILFIDPVNYLDMLQLLRAAEKVITDSGGVQKEAYFLKVPCVTVRTETEWPETVASGWNTLVPFNANAIYTEITRLFQVKNESTNFYGDGRAAIKIADILTRDLLP